MNLATILLSNLASGFSCSTEDVNFFLAIILPYIRAQSAALVTHQHTHGLGTDHYFAFFAPVLTSTLSAIRYSGTVENTANDCGTEHQEGRVLCLP